MRAAWHWHRLPKKLWLPHPWKCSRPGRTGLSLSNLAKGKVSLPTAGAWKEILKLPSNPSHSQPVTGGHYHVWNQQVSALRPPSVSACSLTQRMQTRFSGETRLAGTTSTSGQKFEGCAERISARSCCINPTCCSSHLHPGL